MAFKRVSCKGAIDTLQSISCQAAHAPVLMIPPTASHPSDICVHAAEREESIFTAVSLNPKTACTMPMACRENIPPNILPREFAPFSCSCSTRAGRTIRRVVCEAQVPVVAAAFGNNYPPCVPPIIAASVFTHTCLRWLSELQTMHLNVILRQGRTVFGLITLRHESHATSNIRRRGGNI